MIVILRVCVLRMSVQSGMLIGVIGRASEKNIEIYRKCTKGCLHRINNSIISYKCRLCQEFLWIDWTDVCVLVMVQQNRG